MVAQLRGAPSQHEGRIGRVIAFNQHNGHGRTLERRRLMRLGFNALELLQPFTQTAPECSVEGALHAFRTISPPSTASA